VPAVEEAAVADEEPLEVEAAEPATPDPSPAVAAPPLVDPVAVEPAAADEPLAEGEADAPVPAPRSGMGLLGTLLAVVVVLVVLTTYLAVRVVTTRDGGPTEKARLEALQAARTASRVLFSYDYRHLDKDFAAGKPYTTGSFAKEYQRSTGRVRASATQTKRVVVAEVSEAGVVRATKNQVVALIFLNQQFTSTASVSTRVTLNRLELTMDRRDGRWLVSRIRAF
jgi:Mce-associated membrane protein